MTFQVLLIHAGNTLIMVALILYSIILHELGHAWVAYKFGDNTAKREGRLTLNPLSHIDPLGTIILPLVMFISSGSAFGWAKPVPVNPYNYNHKRADLWVSLAGVILNFFIALLCFALFAWSLKVPGWGGQVYEHMLATKRLSFSIYELAYFPSSMVFLHVAMLNLLLMIFNLLPFPPLDGFHVMMNLLPARGQAWFEKNKTTIMIIFLVLLFTGLLSYIYTPIFNGILRLFLRIFGLGVA